MEAASDREEGEGRMELWIAEGTEGKGAAHALLGALLAGRGILNPAFRRLPGGKPVLAKGGVHFSLSHSGPYALVGMGASPLGVDVERVKPRRPGLPRYVLSDREFEWFTSRGSCWGDFYTLWTLKESRVKYTGSGLDRAPRTISVPLLAPGERAQLEGLWFGAWAGEGWRAACCGEEEPPAELNWEGGRV